MQPTWNVFLYVIAVSCLTFCTHKSKFLTPIIVIIPTRGSSIGLEDVCTAQKTTDLLSKYAINLGGVHNLRLQR